MNKYIINNRFQLGLVFFSVWLGSFQILRSELWVDVPEKVNANEIVEIHYVSSHVSPPDGIWGKAILEMNGKAVGESYDPNDAFDVVFDEPGSMDFVVRTFSTDGKPLDAVQRSVAVYGIGLVLPEENALIPLGSRYFLNADAVFADKVVEYVDFQVSPSGKNAFQNIWGSRDKSHPYSYLWEPSSSGLTDIRAVAHHPGGEVSISAVVCVQICRSNGSTPLDVTILDPSSGSSVAVGVPRQVNVDVSVNDDRFVRSVSLFVNGCLQETVLESDLQFPFRFEWTPYSPGSHSLVAIGQDNSGVYAASEEVNVLVSDDRPFCELLFPGDGSVFQAGKHVPFVAIASGQGSSRERVDGVEFLVNGNAIPLDGGSFLDSEPPFSGTWVPEFPGSYFVSARVIDGVSGTSYQTPSVTVRVEENYLPSVRVIAPYSGDQFYVGETVVLRAKGSDKDGLIAGISFYLNDVLIGEGEYLNGAYMLSHEFNSGGVYDIRAMIVDDASRQQLSDPVSITVQEKQGIRPQIQISWPKNNQSFTTGDTTQFSAIATDEDGNVDSVRFFLNHQPIGESITSFPFRLDDVSFPSSGVYLIEAVAEDNDGNLSIRDKVKVVVEDPSMVRPSIIISKPGNYSTFEVGDRVLILAEAKDYDGVIASVGFTVNGVGFGELDDSFPFQSDLFEVKAPGLHRIEAVAFDEQGNMSPVAESVFYAVPSEKTETNEFNPLEKNRDFLVQIYVDLFMRGPSERELSAFLEHLEYGSLSKVDVVQSLLSTSEYQSLRDIHSVFHGVVGEWPDPVGFASVLQGRDLLMDTAPTQSIDDVKDSFSGAQPILSFDANQSGYIDRFGDVDMFVFQIDAESIVAIESNGPGDTTGTLYNSDQEAIGFDDDSGLFFNFAIQQLLAPGTYYVAVSGWLGASASYSLSFSVGDMKLLPVDSRIEMVNAEASIDAILDSCALAYSGIPEQEGERRALFTHFYENRFGLSPTPQQKLQGASRMLAYDSIASFLSSFVRNEKVGFNDFIYDMPDEGSRDDAAFVSRSFFKEKPLEDSVDLLKALSAKEQIQSILNDERYLSRFQRLLTEPEHPTIVPLSVAVESMDEYEFQTVIKDLEGDVELVNSEVNPFAAVKEVDGWKYLDWFGWFSDLEYPWVYHEHLGWIKVTGYVPDELWIWNDQFQWAYAAKESYPYLFRYFDETWVKVVSGEGPGEFDLE